MSQWITLTASDNHQLGAYIASPATPPRAAIVVIQEIFGVNPSIQGVADFYAAQGYLAIAPALFDRFEKNLQLGYDEADMKKAFDLYARLQPDTQLLDVAAAYAHVAAAVKKVGVVGFCYGGLLSWLSSTRGPAHSMQPAACVGYYPGGVGKVAEEKPTCPVMLHFGTNDDHIGSDQVDAVRKAHKDVEVYLYEDAPHAFANPARPSFVPADAKLADERSLAFFERHLS